MKKLSLLLLPLFLLTACGTSNQDQNDLTPPVTPPVEENPIDEETPAVENEQASIEDKITVETPLKNDEVSSPLTVRGEARGTWFFEGSFPVVLMDDKNQELARGNATSTESWMTEDFIPFEVKLEFDSGSASTGTLILEKDNPSGLEENAGKLEIPVNF